MKTKEIIVLETIADVKNHIGEEKLNQVIDEIIDEYTYDGVNTPYKDYQDIENFEHFFADYILKLGVYDIRNKTYTEIFNEISDEYWESYECYRCDVEKELYDSLISKLEESYSYDYKIEIDAYSLMDLFYERGFVFDLGIEDDLRDAKLNVNLMLGYGKEGDWTYTCAPEIFGDISGYYTGLKCATMLDGYDEKIYYNSMLMYVLYQQGYTLKDLIEYKTKFAKGVYNDLESLATGVASFTISIKISAYDLLRLLSKDCNKNLELLPGVSITQFDPYNGSGSVDDIQLEKSLVISPDMIYEFQIEEGGKNNNGYRLDAVYGMCGSWWSSSYWRFTDEKPIDGFVINFEEAKQALKESMDQREMLYEH